MYIYKLLLYNCDARSRFIPFIFYKLLFKKVRFEDFTKIYLFFFRAN